MTTAGVVLAGGASRRMGCDKGWLPFGEHRMLSVMVRVLKEVVGRVVVVASPGQVLPPLPKDARVVYDPRPGLGPLQGLVTGLSALQDCADTGFLAPCDTPLLCPAFVRQLLRHLGAADIAVTREADYYHPVTAAYRTTVLDRAEALLALGRRRIDTLFSKCRTVEVAVESMQGLDPDLRSLMNINGPDDYRRALAMAGLPPPPEGSFGLV